MELHIFSNSSGSGYLADQTSGGNLTVTSNILVERYISSAGWHNVSSPVASANTSLFSATDLIFYYDETKVLNDWNFGWIWYPSGNFSSFKGYDIYYETGAQNIDYTASGSSSLNTGAFVTTITRTNPANGETENHKGWNLVGNPYPSPVDWLVESGWDKSDINDAKYIWNPSAGNYTIFLGGSNPVGINGGTQFIPSNQGFWVQATTNGSISINNACRKGIMNSTPDYYKNQEIEYPFISLICKGNSLSDETIIRFISQSSPNFDLNLDALKLFSFSDKTPQIASMIENTALAINTLAEITDNMEVPLSFYCQTEGNYSLGLNPKSNILEFQDIYLFDRILKKITNLKQDKIYEFHHLITNINSRFLLIINPSNEKLTALESGDKYSVYAIGKQVFINNLDGEDKNYKLIVSNLMGQRIYMAHFISSSNKFNLNADAGIYVFSILTDKQIFSKKLYIN
jgi:hypothetical protein